MFLILSSILAALMVAEHLASSAISCNAPGFREAAIAETQPQGCHRWYRGRVVLIVAPQTAQAGSLEKAVEKAGSLCNEGPALAKPWDHRLVLDHIRRTLAQRQRP
jgi:hypothetical protein